MKTVLHAYRFDTRNEAEKAAYHALREQLSGTMGLECFESHGGGTHWLAAIDGLTLELETKHVFNNQWNTAPIPGVSDNGYRVFDWAQDYKPNGNAYIKRGHWLEQTAEMKEVRRNTYACGYCGHQEPAQKGNVFCPQCIGSAHLKIEDLNLLRMQAVENTANRAELSEAEKAHLLPLYKDAQLHGNTERDKVRIAKERADLKTKHDNAIEHAETEFAGFTWLMDHGVRTSNVIYYAHTRRFGFGWRNPISDEIKSELLDIISEFPFAYDIKCADGNTLSGG